jgi:hypothetical protein
MRDERDVEHPTVEVSAVGTVLVEDGDAMDAEHIRVEYARCFCLDGKHRREDRTDLRHYRDPYPPLGSHAVYAHMYALITEVEPS